MSFRAYHFDTARLHALFAPRKPRNPLVKLMLGLVGLCVLVAMVFVGVFVGAAMLLVGLGLRLWRQRGKPVAQPRHVVEGEYRVVGKPGLPFAR